MNDSDRQQPAVVQVWTDGCCGWTWDCSVCARQEIGYNTEREAAADASKHEMRRRHRLALERQ